MMIAMKSTIRTQRFCLRRQSCALLSTPADKLQRLTPDDIIAAEKKIENHKKHVRLSGLFDLLKKLLVELMIILSSFIAVTPFDLTAVSKGNSGEPFPENPAELRVFNGNALILLIFSSCDGQFCLLIFFPFHYYRW